jgi:hypothetical protein
VHTSNHSFSKLFGCLLLTTLGACGGSGSTSNSMSGIVPVSISDDASDDWATIAVKIKSIALIPQGGGSAIVVYQPSVPTQINLAELDQLSEVLGNLAIPVGTYTGAILTIAANPGDVSLTASADPESGFAGTASATIPADQIQIQHATGTAGNRHAAVTVNFVSPLAVTTGSNNALDLEVDLNHPAFIVGHIPLVSAGNAIWAVNFNGPVRHHPVRDITRLVLRHSYGSVSGVAGDGTYLTINKMVPVFPITDPETGTATGTSLQIKADASNGTLFYDVDAKAAAVSVTNFTSISSSLANKYVRIAARYQEDGTLTATRIWASSDFNSIWVSPEGHVLHVNTTSNVVDVGNETGGSTRLQIDENTQFYFHASLGNTTPIGTGTSFLSNHNLARGFKIHASVVDPLVRPMVAQSIDIETAAYKGVISNADNAGFMYASHFNTSADNYSVTLPYISNDSSNGTDGSGNAILGFKWWHFAFPTLLDSGSAAIPDFVTATSGAVNFGGTFGSVSAVGVSTTRWADPGNPSGWSANLAILLPTPLPLGTVATGISGNAFTMTVPTGSQAANITFNTTSGSATLVYQIDRSGGVVTISPLDISTNAGLSAFTQNLQSGMRVKVFGTPQTDGTFKAYVINYYTGSVATTM